MASESRPSRLSIFSTLNRYLYGSHMLAILPAIMLGGYWLVGEGALIALALLMPMVFAVSGLYSGTGPAWHQARDNMTGLALRPTAEKSIDHTLAAEARTGQSTAALAIQIDDFEAIQQQFGNRATTSLLKQVAERLAGALRESDTTCRLEDEVFVVALGPTRRIDLETLIQLSARLQAVIKEPFSLDASRVYLTASTGFCIPARSESRSGAALIDCAVAAMEYAAASGPGAVRAYSPEIKARKSEKAAIQKEITSALDAGQIQAWFQPQISTHTGQITGFEALARWQHPERGTILPRDFLPAIADHGLHSRLGEAMLKQALAALRQWDKSGLSIPAVAVNFSGAELKDPSLTEKIKWELDRFELTPDRICIEILEDVIAVSQDDIVVRNVAALSEMGCRIDLDDFGTGHASIANIRRFAVDRIKIDRSFVTRVDRDREQQSMVSAILTMAERLGLETLAEGVETIGEHAMLAQLGCSNVQGFSVGKPMAAADVGDWVAQYCERLKDTPNIGKKAG